MSPFSASPLRLADGLVLLGYSAVLVLTGVWFSRREQKSTAEFFLANRRMPVWAVAVSIIATSLSAATFIGAPEQSYRGDLTYLSTNIGGLIAVVVVAYFFIPAFYRLNVTTVYELLERRFGPSSKYAASAAFMAGRVFASGARIYIGAIPLAMILFGVDAGGRPAALIFAICALTAVGTVYALLGGIAGVIWTDVIQTIVLVVAVLAVIILLYSHMDASPDQMITELRQLAPEGSNWPGLWGKLTLIRTGLNPEQPGWGFDRTQQFTLLTAVFGFSLLNIAAYGADHDLVQRMLTCRSAIQGSRSVLLSMAIGLPIVTLFSIIGILLFVNYQMPLLSGHLHDWQKNPFYAKDVFLTYILCELPPGLGGLLIAGLFAAGVGSLTSAVNAMAATSIKDFYTRLAPGRGERHYLAASKLAVVGWGIVLAAFAVLCVFWQRASPGTTLIGLALGVMTFAYTGLLAVFATALFTGRGNNRSVIAAIVVGFVVVALLQPPVWVIWTPWVPVIGSDLHSASLAFPWHMTIGAALAFVVCVAGRPTQRIPSVKEGSTRRCAHCGYDLTGVAAGNCPECGEAVVYHLS